MSKIDDSGLEKLQYIKNALDAIYDKLEAKGSFNDVASEFEYIANILNEVRIEWERVQ